MLNLCRDIISINMQLQQTNHQTRNYNKPTIKYQDIFKAIISSHVRNKSNYQEAFISKQHTHHIFGTAY